LPVLALLADGDVLTLTGRRTSDDFFPLGLAPQEMRDLVESLRSF